MQIKRSAERSFSNIVQISVVIIGHYNSNNYKIEQLKVVYYNVNFPHLQVETKIL